MNDSQNLHATGIVVQGMGLLIRGRAGAGKSLLALELLRNGALRGEKVLLVADDQLFVRAVTGGLEMEAPAEIAGKIELRGRGIVYRSHVGRSRVHLVVDLVDKLERMPEESQFSTRIKDIEIARCPVPERTLIDPGHQILLVEEAMASLVPAHPFFQSP
jgi:serine kinase of HPr protein (carbohydrate metabolism regulator)